jgi:NAD(P)-dependent dehydrogenase (short-subunit alcohol dehydrogenase family)
VTDIQQMEGQAVAAEITKRGGVARFWLMDVTSESSVKGALVEIHGHFGRSDVLVDNAGIAGADKPTHEVTEEEWDEVMDVNVKGSFSVRNTLSHT